MNFLFSNVNSEDDLSNTSDNQNRSRRHVHYMESSCTSNDSESNEMDDYLDEAMYSDEDADDYEMAENRNRRHKESVSDPVNW